MPAFIANFIVCPRLDRCPSNFWNSPNGTPFSSARKSASCSLLVSTSSVVNSAALACANTSRASAMKRERELFVIRQIVPNRLCGNHRILLSMKKFDSRWRTWLRHNIDRGCSKDELFTILIKEGFEPIEIQHEMKYSPEMNYTPAMPSPVLESAPGGPSKELLPGLRRHESALLELYTVDDFLTRKVCEGLVKLIKARLRPSAISHAGAPDSTFRTSRTCDLDGRNAVVGKLDRAICAAMKIP